MRNGPSERHSEWRKVGDGGWDRGGSARGDGEKAVWAASHGEHACTYRHATVGLACRAHVLLEVV